MSSRPVAGPWLVVAPAPGGRPGRGRAASLRAQRGAGPPGALAPPPAGCALSAVRRGQFRLGLGGLPL